MDRGKFIESKLLDEDNLTKEVITIINDSSNSTQVQEKRVKKNSTLKYTIENGMVTIAGKMPILEESDQFKQSMMKRCEDVSCNRTIVFSPDYSDPSWKHLAENVINIFYEENISSGSFSVGEDKKIKIVGEFPNKKSKDRLSMVLKKYEVYDDINDTTYLKVLQQKEETLPIVDENISDTNSSAKSINEHNISSLPLVEEQIESTIAVGQKKISEILKKRTINFHRNRAKITSSGIKTLNEVVAILKGLSDIEIEVKGYTDASGKKSINQWISHERAKSVKKYLGKKGINLKDIKAKGFGEEGLLYKDKPYSKANRRVEIEIKRKKI
jgi:outer membrane protein OmpA-like peptidoglycan-associated protein